MPEPPAPRGRLFRKYVSLVVTVVCAALLAHGLFGIWFSFQDHKAAFAAIQREQAVLAAAKIGQFIKEIEGQLGWLTQVPWSAITLEQRNLDALRLLRQVPAITELAVLDDAGREQLRISRVAMDIIGSDSDRSREPPFLAAMERKVYYGPVYFRRGSEPYLTLALAGDRRDAGIVIAEVNLIHVWDVVSQLRVGEQGKAYVVDATGRLIAHPDISLVLRNTDFAGLAQVQAARAGTALPIDHAPLKDAQGGRVLAAYAPIVPPGWLVLVELPLQEALAPVYASLVATGLVLLGGLLLALLASVILARQMVKPIRVLQVGAARIGSGALDHRIAISTGDELEVLGGEFNRMAAQLQESYATLERKVDERTHQLALANLAKSRFLAAASHDLRQPMHALNLFVAQLHHARNPGERQRLIGRIDAAVAGMNELFDALLDISKLDAGVLTPDIGEFPIALLFKRLETTFAGAAREKGLELRLLSSGAWVRSDCILLERILLNLVSNAVCYTARGGVLVGCRRRGALLRIEVWDTGIGIPQDQRRHIFGEFYQLAGSERDRRGGLGLGLAIVDRLGTLLDHPVELKSVVGKGSRFCVSVPAGARRSSAAAIPPFETALNAARGKLVLVVDDDALVLEGMRGVLQSWGCRVVTAESDQVAVLKLAEERTRPDLIISDYRLAQGATGFELIEGLQEAFGPGIPAFLISGDTAPERLRDARASGYLLLHKPVQPMTLRAMLNRMLKKEDGSGGSIAAPARNRPLSPRAAAGTTQAPSPQ
jgi:signal transduction histidine kinase/DNA-binding NarL/FixJ family response regulator